MAKPIELNTIGTGSWQREDTPKAPRTIRCRILIVCEGEKTEPNYFKAFGDIRRGHYVFKFDIKTAGGGISTTGVVDKAIALRDEADKKGAPYDSVWAVFDKDSFPANSFNAAIKKAEKNGIQCAWSNEAFEIWYLLHFQNRITAMKRDEYKDAISDAVNNSPKNTSKKKDFKYAKNASDNHQTMNRYGDQEKAIRYAKALHDEQVDERFHTHNPCTVVYKLVLQLTGRDKDFNNKVSDCYNNSNL